MVFAGQVSEEDLPRYYAMGDVFAMPCRTRLGGMEVEGWGNVFIEAAACGRPIVVGDSGGARETVVDGETGTPGRRQRTWIRSRTPWPSCSRIPSGPADGGGGPRAGGAGARLARDRRRGSRDGSGGGRLAALPRSGAGGGYAPGMADTPPTTAEKRCANCGAVLYEGAAWCGMCFEPVAPDRAAEPEPEPEPEPTGTAALRGDDGGRARRGRCRRRRLQPPTSPTPDRPMWPCPVCDARNPIELDVCATCGASFASLMRQETARVRVDPRAAFRRSLMFPGLGHRMIPGREVDGFARGVLFAMLLIATLMLGLSGVHAGAVQFLFLVYLTASVLVYVLTAFEASRLAEGGEPLVSSRALLWATVADLDHVDHRRGVGHRHGGQTLGFARWSMRRARW